MQPVDPILNPSLFFGGYEWREPITTLTDFLVSLICWYAFYRLQTYRGKKPANFNFYKYYFLCFAIGMSSAAWLGHGFQAYVGPRFKAIGWLMSATGFLMLATASLYEIKSTLRPLTFKALRTFFILGFILFMAITIHPSYSQFWIAQLNSTIMLIGVILPMQFYHYRLTKSRGSLIVVASIVYGIIPGVVYQNQISFNRWYNYHDISHTLMALFMVAMFIGITKLIEEGKDKTPEHQFTKMSATSDV